MNIVIRDRYAAGSTFGATAEEEEARAEDTKGQTGETQGIILKFSSNVWTGHEEQLKQTETKEPRVESDTHSWAFLWKSAKKRHHG